MFWKPRKEPLKHPVVYKYIAEFFQQIKNTTIILTMTGHVTYLVWLESQIAAGDKVIWNQDLKGLENLKKNKYCSAWD